MSVNMNIQYLHETIFNAFHVVVTKIPVPSAHCSEQTGQQDVQDASKFQGCKFVITGGIDYY